ncbi:LysM domain-containing protein [Paenibacillus sp. yr247]|uniref:LysM peptidoglycan-binding domain-containing protein n=1 Tax=Paenibacillus sp. yr247 TaxID=1761880 RepID=UPI0008896B9E|nr:LysM domain-containing protein [Paenibacillus sp. yr247]SDN05447.1 LysM domain-containing protein [Paenibacillus sp. yr247]
MERAFGGFGQPTFFNPFFTPFVNPFIFPRRRFIPFFFLSPFFFPFFRGEDDRDGTYFSQHTIKDGDTMGKLAQTYNVPGPILEVVNPHIQNLNVLAPGSIIYIPRMDKMYCHKMYLEQEAPETGAPSPMYPTQQTMPYTGTPSHMYPGQQMPPYSYTGTQQR